MNKYKQLSELPDEKFRRLTGVKRKTFEKMAEILGRAHKQKKRQGGRPNKLCVEDISGNWAALMCSGSILLKYAVIPVIIAIGEDDISKKLKTQLKTIYGFSK